MRHLLGWGRPVLAELLFHVRNLPFASPRALQTAPGSSNICELAVPVPGSATMPSSKPDHKTPSKRKKPAMEAPARAGGTFVVETSPDPLDGTSVRLRVRPISDAEIAAADVAGQMLTTQQAAAKLNVSRPYVAALVNKGTFTGVELTGGGHRRIPAVAVQRVRTCGLACARASTPSPSLRKT